MKLWEALLIISVTLFGTWYIADTIKTSSDKDREVYSKQGYIQEKVCTKYSLKWVKNE